MNNTPRLLVLKFGTTSVCELDTLEIREQWIRSVAEDVKDLIAKGIGVIIFSSGGLATGRKRILSSLNKEILLKHKSLLGAVGLSELLYKWQKNFDVIGLPTATLTIREEDIEATSICDLITEMVNNGITPIINENIPLQKNFNNDELAAKVCSKLSVSQFILFTDTDGVFTANPKTNPKARHLKRINIDALNIQLEDTVAGLGSGGMKAKLQSAIKVKKAGIDTIIANGTDFHPLENLNKPQKHTILDMD